MAGLEAAGVALAVFPIVVNGLDHIVAGIETIRRWKLYKVRLREYANILESARVYFLDTLDELLGDIVFSDEELRLLLREPGGDLWRNPQYDARLQERLDRSYSSYTRTIKTLVHAMKSLGKRLGVDSVDGIQWEDYSILEREMKRLKMAFSKNAYKDLLDEMWQANRDLREITHQNIAQESVKRKRRKRRSNTNLKLVRNYASSLYQVLMTEKAWKCTCKMCHMASLRLEARPQTMEAIKADTSHGHRFRVLLSVTDIDDQLSTSRWSEIEVIPSIESQTPVKALQRTLADPHPQHKYTPKAVKFAPQIGSSVAESSEDVASSKGNRKCIQDFCNFIWESDKTDKEIGLLVDEGTDKHEHRLYRADTVIEAAVSSTSLGEILKDSQNHSPDEGLRARDRLQLAVILASSVLQLDGTLWLKSQWSIDDIFFHYSKDQPKRKLQYSCPYLSWQRCCNRVSDPVEHSRLSSPMFRSDVLLALGLALVELCFSRTLADMWKPEDNDTNKITTRMRTATRLLGSVAKEMGLEYDTAVRKCIYQPFDVQELSLEIDEVRQQVSDDILTPLMIGLDNFYGL